MTQAHIKSHWIDKLTKAIGEDTKRTIVHGKYVGGDLTYASALNCELTPLRTYDYDDLLSAVSCHNDIGLVAIAGIRSRDEFHDNVSRHASVFENLNLVSVTDTWAHDPRHSDENVAVLISPIKIYGNKASARRSRILKEAMAKIATNNQIEKSSWFLA